MASNFKCPFCNSCFPIIRSTFQETRLSFESLINNSRAITEHDFAVDFVIYRCPSCSKDTMAVNGVGDKFKGFVLVNPRYSCIQFPEYVPQQIRNDYQEACAIKDSSPKASATLARRCLQGIIRDFWGISKSRLVDEIDDLNDKVDPSLWEVIDKVRRIGNIGAHMEKDVNVIVDIDPDEAGKLIQLIELLIKDWYIARKARQDLFASIVEIDTRTQEERKG